MAARASVVIEIDESGVVTGFKQVEGGLEKIGQKGNVVMTQMRRQHEQAHDAARLLGQTLGIELPRQLDKFLAKSQTIGPILAQAFNVAIFAGFAGAAVRALTEIPTAVNEIIESMTHWHAQTEEAIKLTGEWGQLFKETTDKARAFREELSLIGLAGSKRDSQVSANLRDQLKQAQEDLHIQQQIKDDLERRATQTIPSASPGLSKVLTQDAIASQAKIEDQVKAVNKAAAAVGALSGQLLVAEANQRKAFSDETRAEIEKTTKAIKDQGDAIRFVSGFSPPPTLLHPGEVTNSEAFDAIAKGTDERLKQMGNAAAMAAEIQRDADRQTAEDFREHMRQQEEAARNFAQMRRDLAQGIAGFFDDITTGNIGQRFRKMFRDLVSGMVADWILGVNQMSAASSSGGGQAGGVRGVLGNVFGIGAGGGLAGTPPFLPGATSSGGSLAGLPLSAGGAVGPSTTLPAGASISGPGGGVIGQAAGGAGGFLGRTGIGGILSQVGATIGAASALGFGSPVRGAISGAAGAVLGSSALAAAFPSTIPFLAGLGVPVIGAIGAGIGLLIGVLSNGKRASARHDLQMQEFRDLQTIEDQFKFGGLDYDAARSTLEQMREGYVGQFAKLRGKRDFVDPFVDNEIAKINQIEQQREAQQAALFAEQQRRQGIQFSPAMFRNGGLVDLPMRFGTGGEVPAILHTGEFVMRPEAVRQQGVAKLQAMNDGKDGGGRGGNTYNVRISAIDARGFAEFLKRGGMGAIYKHIQNDRADGWRYF